MSFRSMRQFLLCPAETLEAFDDKPLSTRFYRFLHGFTEVGWSGSGVNLFEQFTPELLSAQVPATLQTIEFLIPIRNSTPFHVLFENLTTCGTVFGNAPFAKQSVHPQPHWPSRRRKVEWKTAPRES